jgi:hypothetical protein
MKTSPEGSIAPIHNLEDGGSEYDADEFLENDAATVDHGVALNSFDESTRKPLDVEGREGMKATFFSVGLECIGS